MTSHDSDRRENWENAPYPTPEVRTIRRNGQTVTCYGPWLEDSNCMVIFEDDSFDGIYADGAKNWIQAVEILTDYAKRVGTTVIEMVSC